MASKKKNIEKVEEINEEVINPVEQVTEPEEEKQPKKEEKVNKKEENKNQPKYAIGNIVFVSKDADADLNGFKLFPQYKKYTYTVEAYDQNTGVYSLRRLNLSLKLKEHDIIAPDEKSGSELFKKQF